MKIIIADDDKAFAESYAQAVLSENDNIIFAKNAEELIALAKETKIDLIITDNQMKDGLGSSGIYAICEIRKFNKDVPIILHSSNLEFHTSIEALEAGANIAMKKIFVASQIKEAIKKYY